MPLTEKTERALEACHDAILAPTRWPSALQSLGELLGAASCMFFEHDRENSPAPAPMSEGHVAFADRLTRNWAHAPDPHVGPYLQKCNSFQRAGWASVLEHDLSTEEERCTIPFYQETARPEKREWMAGSFFSVEGRNWCLPVFRGGDPFTREHARRLARVGPYLAKIVSLARKFAAFDLDLETLGAGASQFRRHRHRRNGPRKANERACARSAGRRLQPRPGSSGGPRSRQQSPTAAAGFVCFACGTRQRSGLSRQSSSIGMKRLGFWLRRCPSRRSAAICSAPVA